MTRKHFEEAAAIVRGAIVKGERERRVLADGFATLFSRFNPNFNRARFMKACGLSVA